MTCYKATHWLQFHTFTVRDIYVRDVTLVCFHNSKFVLKYLNAIRNSVSLQQFTEIYMRHTRVTDCLQCHWTPTTWPQPIKDAIFGGERHHKRHVGLYDRCWKLVDCRWQQTERFLQSVLSNRCYNDLAIETGRRRIILKCSIHNRRNQRQLEHRAGLLACRGLIIPPSHSYHQSL